MLKFTINCKFGNEIIPVDFFAGNSSSKSHPIGFQMKLIASRNGGKISANAVKYLQEFKDIAEKNRIDFEELCEYIAQEKRNADEIKEEKIKYAKKIEFFAKKYELIENDENEK